MTMKLFTPSQVRSATEERQDKDVKRAVSIRDATAQLLEDLAKAEKDFADSMKYQQEAHANLIENHTKQKAEMFSEIRDLERRKEIALIPIQSKEEELYNREEEMAQKANELRLEESDLEEREEAYMRRLDQVGEREAQVQSRIQMLESQERGLKEQMEDFKEQSMRLSASITEHAQKSSQENDHLNSERVILEGRKTIADERERSISEREQQVESDKIRLTDRWATLEREMRRLKK